ncbi:MAG: SPFH domain-containing protein [Fimbriimonadaceae bacterium]
MLDTLAMLSPEALALVAGFGFLIAFVLLIQFVKAFLHLCPPNEILIFSGRGQRLSDGSTRRFRVIFGGRGLRIPIIESVHRMSLNLVEVPIAVRGAYSQGGVPLNVDAIANVKISSEPKVVGNAIERFLGRDPNEIRRVAKETLEGHLRGVLARLTPEEVNEDRLKFADELTRECELDLSKLGIHLDTLKIQHVSDDVSYLDSIGREAIANVIKSAEMAESDAKREAELAEASNAARANITQAGVDAQIARLRNELRRIQAELESAVRSEEERTLAAAREARAKAEQELQQIRAELEGIRLQADQVLPAEAHRKAQEFRARGDAAILRERGQAVGQAVTLLNEAWKEAGPDAMSVYLIEDIEKLMETAAKGVAKIKVDRVQVIDGSEGTALPQYLGAYTEMLRNVFGAVADTTGIDIPKSIASQSGVTEEASKENRQ